MSWWRWLRCAHWWHVKEAIGTVHVQNCVWCGKTRIRFETTESRRPMRRPAAR